MASLSPGASTVERALRRFPRLSPEIRTCILRMAQASPVECDEATWAQIIRAVREGVA